MNRALDELSLSYMNGLEADEDQPDCPRHLRWERILTQLPLVRGRKLHEDMTDVYQQAYATAQDEALFNAFDLACLQASLFRHLFETKHMSHIHVYWMTYAYYWRHRLGDRVDDAIPEGNGPWVAPERTEHAWIN